MKIEIIAGSPRSNSVTRRVSFYLKERLLKETSHEIGIIDMQDWDLPPVKSVFSSVESTPSEYQPLAKRIFEADAFILLTPEYNGSYSPTMKNLIDHFPKQKRKAFGIVTASTGALGGMRAAQHLLLLVPALFGIASPFLLLVPAVEKKFTERGELIDTSFENSVHNFLTEFLWLATAVNNEKATQL